MNKWCYSILPEWMCDILFEFIFMQKSGSDSYVESEAPDVFCIQETKCQENDIPEVNVNLLCMIFQYFCSLFCWGIQTL